MSPVAKATTATKARAPLVRAPKDGWWEETLEVPPRKAVVHERTDKPRADGVPPLYVRQWSPELGNWQKESLGTSLYDLRAKRLAGKELTAARQTARAAATAVLARWAAARDAAARVAAGDVPDAAPTARPLTIAETAAVITDRAQGKYPHDTPYRRELLRALTFAARIWGAGLAWNAVGKAQLRELGRARVDELRARGKRGLRPAEITVGCVLAVATWLRDEDRIDERAALPSSTWKQELREYWSSGNDGRPYEVQQPRHTREESRQILEAAASIDPRLDLLLSIGAELRAGQVERVRRSDVTMAADGVTPELVEIHTRGKKKGTTVLLTRGQALTLRLALERGYLRRLEAAFRAGTLADYRLFPAGPLRGGRLMKDPVALVETHALGQPIAKTALLDWFHDAERAAGVTPVPGRAFYGIRRGGVDDVLLQKISKHGLKHFGGWSDTQIPDTVYADQEARGHLEEARDARARFRGEASATPIAAPSDPPRSPSADARTAPATTPERTPEQEA